MKYVDPKCRLCRREGVKLFLKGERCFSPQCPLEKKGAVPPGVHGQKNLGRGRLSEYGRRLREKQKLKRLYGVTEKQFKKYVNEARRARTETGKGLLAILETRLDNVVYRLGFAPAKSAAKQLVAHGHIWVDEKKVDISSYRIKPGQVVTLRPRSLKIKPVIASLGKKDFSLPAWLERKGPVGKVKRLPRREEIGGDIDERLVVEYFSR